MIAVILITVIFCIVISGIIFICSFLGIKKSPIFILIGVSFAMLICVIILAVMTYHRIISL